MDLRDKPGADKPNRHPVDQLAELRDAIKNLQAREEALRRQLLETDDLKGAEWQAELRVCRWERLDKAALLKEFGRATLRPFLKMSAFTQIFVKRR